MQSHSHGQKCRGLEVEHEGNYKSPVNVLPLNDLHSERYLQVVQRPDQDHFQIPFSSFCKESH